MELGARLNAPRSVSTPRNHPSRASRSTFGTRAPAHAVATVFMACSTASANRGALDIGLFYGSSYLWPRRQLPAVGSETGLLVVAEMDLDMIGGGPSVWQFFRYGARYLPADGRAGSVRVSRPWRHGVTATDAYGERSARERKDRLVGTSLGVPADRTLDGSVKT